MSIRITSLSDKELENYSKKRKDNYNFYHYATFSMSKEGFDKFIEELKINHYHFNLFKPENNNITKLHLKKGKRHNYKKDKIKKLTTWDYEGLMCFEISWIDNAESDYLGKILDNLEFNMIYTGESGGWDATPYYLIGSIKDKKWETVYNLYKNNKAFRVLKSLEDKKHKFYSSKLKLEEIEKYLKELGMKEKEIEDYILKPNEYLFNRTVIEVVLTNEADGLINMLKGRLGYPDAKPF